MYTLPTSDLNVPVRRLQLDAVRGKLVPVEKKEPFIKGPIPLDWLSRAAALPGKAINLALALWWLQGMAKGKPFKLTQAALKALNVKRDAASAGLAGLEEVGLIWVEQKAGPASGRFDRRREPTEFALKRWLWQHDRIWCRVAFSAFAAAD